MRILYICRVFSGFEKSVNSRVWKPAGAPTVYKIIEALDSSEHEVHFVMTGKGIGHKYNTGLAEDRNQQITLSGLRNPITFLSGETRLPRFLGRLRRYLDLIYHSWLIWMQAKKTKPHLVYVDRSNLVPGALLARFSKMSVVLRVMGVYPSMWDIFGSWHPMESLQRWAYKSPFCHVICTQDGSGGEIWLDRALNTKTSRQMMLNGVNYQLIKESFDDINAICKVTSSQLMVLFIGRLEGIKGCSEFVEAMLKLVPKFKNKILVVIAGSGSLQSELEEKICEFGAVEMFSLIQNVPHNLMVSLQKRSDIYVSLNKAGNLSNANLEALASGCCMIIPKARLDLGVDKITDQIIPEDAVIRISNKPSQQITELADRVSDLLKNSNERERLSRRAIEVARITIPEWKQRIKKEIALLEQLS